ncbi:xylose isomerase [Alicyclobacillus cellulosilyticus]|uniref:Xylose isomerase n=1 Tax=Alicyclobacillus cellulosilyticus TaxID=1003997 RepID=A0A917KEX7_9BACL|nr:sugar phosphate isomerase/epimerase family protein [Alicyclobacillus cellulosilyticus]GGJ11712.1 xylose isomerase [Alicyclobacillus cellulosilyticus]
MKFAAQENLVPGATFREKVQHLKRLGYEGVELRGDHLAERVQEVKAALRESGIAATCICGGFKFGLLFPNKADREESKAQIKQLLAIAADVGAEGVIVVPIFGGPQIPDLSPWKTAVELERELLVEQLAELAAYAGTQGTKVILEPLNRYETHLLNRLEQAAEICDRVGSPHMTVLADFFHMNIEEADIAASLRAAGRWLGYVHLADSNRVVPGLGHTDFKSGFAALRDIGYAGWMSLECGVPGDPLATLARSLAFMKEQLSA